MKDIADKDIGDTLSPDEYNSTQEENENVVTSAGLVLNPGTPTEPDPDTNQLSRSITRYASGADYYACTGTSPVYVLSQNLTFKNADNYFDGMKVRFEAYFDNGTNSQINVNSFGARDLIFTDGTVIPSGYISTGDYIEAVYIGTPSIGKFKLLTTFPGRHPLTLGARFEHQEILGTPGGSVSPLTGVGTAIRKITDIIYNNIPGLVINTGTYYFIPPAGRYHIRCEQVFEDFSKAITFINNATQSNTPLLFSPSISSSEVANDPNHWYPIEGILTFNGTDEINIKVEMYQVGAPPLNHNLGSPAGSGLPSIDKERYMITTITKIIN
jgi:hypothetical protein